MVAGWLRLPGHWTGLISVSVATAVAVLAWERGRWPLGLFVRPGLATRDFAWGGLFGLLLVGVCAVLVDVSTELRHEFAGGFPWLELLLVFIPAALHEELLFRGYAFQKLAAWNRWVAVIVIALFFAGLHANNVNVTNLGLANIFLGGILLGLAFLRTARLWYPFGLHLAWNLMAGPITGHEVSGYVSDETVLVTRGEGPLWLTGGDFGIEGSLWMTGVELVAIGLLLRWIGRMGRMGRTSPPSVP